MSIKSFKNQGLFTGVLDVDGFGVDTFNNGLNAEKQQSALLFDGLDSEDDVTNGATVVFDGSTYTMDIDEAYDGKVFAIINKFRQSVQFTYDKSTTAQTPTAITFDSVGPEVRRLAALGYV